MSSYYSIVPENISSNTFNYHDATIEIETDNIQPGYKAYMFFTDSGCTTLQYSSPPHFVGIKSNEPLIVDQFDFTGLKDGINNGWMSVKEFKIESSMDEETWDTLYSGTIPFAQSYTQSCEFKPIKCKSIRCTILSTYSPGGQYATWFQGKNFKIYGTLTSRYKLYTNPDAYAIPKEGENNE